jgi:hypothetical protein
VRVASQWLAAGTSTVLLCCFGVAQSSTSPESISLNTLVDAMQSAQAKVRPQISYQVIRDYRIFGARNTESNSEVVAEVDFRPPANKQYRIQVASGSERARQVIRHVLDHEVEASTNKNRGQADINRSNYDFTYLGETVVDGQPCYRLGLRPKRNEKDLIVGEALVDQHSFLVRQVEGDVAKTPSWWLRKVHVKLEFAELEGTWLQTNMEAVADVRIVGVHTLTSRTLDYRGAGEVAAVKSASSRSPRNTYSHRAFRANP